MNQLTVIALIAITLSLTMSGCVAPDGTWEIDGTVKHADDEVVPSPTPEVIYVTQTPEIIYVTVTPTPAPTAVVTPAPTIEPEMTEVVDDSQDIIIGSEPDPEPIPEPTLPPLEVLSRGCEDLDQDVLVRYDHNYNGLIDSNEMETAKLGYESNYETPDDYAQILYAYAHHCPVGSTISPTPEPKPAFIDPVITIDPPLYSGVVRNNGEILDIRITPDPLIAGGDLRIEIDVLNTGTTRTCYELEWFERDPEQWIYAGDMKTFVFTSMMGEPGDRAWIFELYWDAEWPESNVLLQTATVDVHCYTQYEVRG